MPRTGFISPDVPSPAGPYSHAVRIDNIVPAPTTVGVHLLMGLLVEIDLLAGHGPE
ncbi:MAG: hypothetical protein BMS9Abin12_2295 [Acidimicrobiia bacterium]|nr:MAG: hypothetical protein BMS9Abin12_2295 [Acidimicrobiia bacterium]